MKLRPIIMTAESVRATIDGHKTQVRGIITDAMARRGMGFPREMLIDLSRATVDPGFPDAGGVYRFGYLKVPFARPDDGWEKDPNDDTRMRCYAPWSPGDVLWVREAFQPLWRTMEFPPKHYRKSVEGWDIKYCATDWVHDWCDLEDNMLNARVSPMFMPLNITRLFLRVEAVRAERLQDISGGDGKAEGYLSCADFIDRSAWCREHWDANPWVWVVSYSVLSTTGVDGLPDDVAAIVRAKVQQRKEDR